jgi:hypothetical protein
MFDDVVNGLVLVDAELRLEGCLLRDVVGEDE